MAAAQKLDIFKSPIVHPADYAGGTSLFFLNKPCIPSHSRGNSFNIGPIRPQRQVQRKYRNNIVRAGYVLDKAQAVEKGGGIRLSQIPVTAIVTVKAPAITDYLTSVNGIFIRGINDIIDVFGRSIFLELISADLDPNTGSEKKPITGFARLADERNGELIYESNFVIPSDYGEIGAILVNNEHLNETFLKSIVLDGFPDGPLQFSCSSWVEPKSINPDKRIFFSDKSYLPLQTPEGLKSLRQKDLVSLRGDGTGERKASDRIYDYDVYNDLANSPANSGRPVLGGNKQFPYPRRCRTGRPPWEKDLKFEARYGTFYVPRDEDFSAEKNKAFIGKTIQSALDAVVPFLQSTLTDPDRGFPAFKSINQLYEEDVPPLITERKDTGSLLSALAGLFNSISDAVDGLTEFDLPELARRDKFSWLRDEEFARETLAGLNPYSIKLVTEWPLKSSLDPDVYGPPDSAITTELVEGQIKDYMTVEEALERKKLFIIDYHDLLVPYVSKVRKLEGTTLYGSRALFFLTPDGTLKPVAIELTRPPMDGKPQWKRAFTPSVEATDLWYWRFAKAHFLAHDSGYHQLVSHWLRTHCVTETYIIAANRQLSAMHPIYRLLHPHFRYTMKINALARQLLISAAGIIEQAFTPKRYAIELSSVAYDLLWRFDKEALPADLINRGLAVEDPDCPHGLKLTIPDYPFANDGLLLWDSLKHWVTDYVNHYYKDASMVESDAELQAWWTEVRTKGHEDKKDEPWWPSLKTPQDLIEIVTTIVWVTSGHHAAVNFGQYDYAGYFPNRPTIARTKMPCEDQTDEERERFLENPDSELLLCFPSQVQATLVVAILATLSNHSPDEEYIGKYMEPAWGAEPEIKRAFEKFSKSLKDLEDAIDNRNKDASLKNRTGAGVVPYELLKPTSKPGVTGEGVPYSISI